MFRYWLDHLHLSSPDPLRTADFYEEKLGAVRLGVRELPDARTNVDLDLNGLAIKVMQPRAKSLVSNTPQKVCGLEHFGLGTDNIESAVEELKARGVKIVQDITPRPGLKLAFLLAPDDVLIELLERSNG